MIFLKKQDKNKPKEDKTRQKQADFEENFPIKKYALDAEDEEVIDIISCSIWFGFYWSTKEDPKVGKTQEIFAKCRFLCFGSELAISKELMTS